jgi:hypothetical protein
MSTELETLLAKTAIREVLANFNRGIDLMDDDMVCATWHPGGRAIYDGFFEGTGEGLCAAARASHSGFLAHAHQITNCVIEVKGDLAASETYVEANVLFETDGKQVMQSVFGRYLDQWSRREGRWAIDVRHFVRTFSFKREVEATVGACPRSPQDESYELFARLKAA